ncbi:unnamed protein product [Mesocestoides corti]|uniref:LIM zinc-binding domain-containing protein n=1 Tax=Mesocestoides corti TaxID=53468 RepID=A0A0R3ULD7_MESCO|nr:unnamed protein product [Mesocestoides corti]
MDATIGATVPLSYQKVKVTRTHIMNKSKSAIDPLGEPRKVVVRSLSVSQPLDIELRRHQRIIENQEHLPKRLDSPSFIIKAPRGDKSKGSKWKGKMSRKSRGRSRRRRYGPSLERFPPPRITKSSYRIVQEMPFWRLDANKFRRTVSTFESREVRESKWRLAVLQDMPFSQLPWKKMQKLFTEPDSPKLRRNHVEQDVVAGSTQLNTPNQPEKGSSVYDTADYGAFDPAIKVQQRSVVEKDTTFVDAGLEVMNSSAGPEGVKNGPSQKPPKPNSGRTLKEDKKPAAGKPPDVNPQQSIRTRVGGSECRSCDRRAYRAESIEALGQVFHNSCFRCSGCSTVLHRGNWNHKEGNFYCNPCHRKLTMQTFRR